MPLSLQQTHVNSNAISQYIKTISTNNKNTGVQYLNRLKNFEIYFSKTYDFTIDNYLINKIFKIDVYKLLSEYAFYLTNNYVSPDGFKLSNITIKNTINSIRNFLEYHDIEINQRKFKLKVKLPKVEREDKEALTKDDIIKILHACRSYKLRMFLHFLAVTGCRASEACSIRIMNLDFKDCKVNIPSKATKTKVGRYIFLTDELIENLKEYFKHKYRKRVKYYKTGEPPTVFLPEQKETDLVFASYFCEGENKREEDQQDISNIYNNLLLQFDKTLDLLKISHETLTKRRHKITFHSFRRWAKSTISDLGYADFSEWWIGHKGSDYYKRSYKDKFELFKRIEPYLTFNQTDLEARHKDTESRLEIMEQKNIELTNNINKIMEMIRENPKLAQVKPEALVNKKGKKS